MTSLIIEKLLSKTTRTDLPEFVAGDTIRVHAGPENLPELGPVRGDSAQVLDHQRRILVSGLDRLVFQRGAVPRPMLTITEEPIDEGWSVADRGLPIERE